MPLEVDGEYRGAHAVHVYPHPKLGKPHEGAHRTLIEPALPLVNWLIDDDEVKRIALGKIVHAGSGGFHPRVEIQQKGQKLSVLLVAKSVAQGLVVHTTRLDAVQSVATRIKAKWEADTTGATTLRLVDQS